MDQAFIGSVSGQNITAVTTYQDLTAPDININVAHLMLAMNGAYFLSLAPATSSVRNQSLIMHLCFERTDQVPNADRFQMQRLDGST